jgi:hypothetical protein
LLIFPVAAPCMMCKYGDPQGNLHYANVAPESDWTFIECFGLDVLTDANRPPKSAPAVNVSPPSPAWRAVGGTNEFDLYIRPDSIRREGQGTTKVWFLTDYALPSVLPRDPKRYKSQMSLYRVDCNDFKLGLLQSVGYSSANGKGGRNPAAANPSPPLTDVIPDSVGESMVRVVCNTR